MGLPKMSKSIISSQFHGLKLILCIAWLTPKKFCKKIFFLIKQGGIPAIILKNNIIFELKLLFWVILGCEVSMLKAIWGGPCVTKNDSLPGVVERRSNVIC